MRARPTTAGLLALAAALPAPAARAQCGPHEALVLDPPAPASGARFGEALALFGERLFVGAPREAGPAPEAGAVSVFARGTARDWIAVERLAGTAAGERFGSALAAEGGLLAVGAPGAGLERGAVRLFAAAAGSWLPLPSLEAADGAPGDQFGAALALSGEALLVGAPGRAQGSGAAYLYVRDRHGSWLERARWTAPRPATGAAAGAAFGASLDLEGRWALVGAPDYAAPDAAGGATGAVFAFEAGPGGWAARGPLAPGTLAPLDAFGASVSLCGARALVGVPRRDAEGGAVNCGAALLFARGPAPSGWTPAAVLAPRVPRPDELFGERAALAGSTALVGAPDSDEGGAVYVLRREPGTEVWAESARLVASDGGQRYGAALALAAGGSAGFAGAPAKDLPGAPSAGGAYGLAGLDQPLALATCAPGTSAQGCRAWLSTSGVPSASSASGFTVLARGADGASLGTFLFGTHGRAALPFGRSSTLCIAPPLARTRALTGSGAGGTCSGAFALDLAAFWAGAPAAAPGAGAVVELQLWYRDAASPSAGALSSALELALCP